MRNLALMGVALAANLGTSPLSIAGISDSDVLVRSEFELQSLRSLLGEEDAWNVLYRLSRRYPVWALATSTINQEPGEFEHSFVFASRRGLSTRSYRVDYRSSKQEDGTHRIAPERSRFVTWRPPVDNGPPVPGPVSLKVFRAAVNDTGVREDLVSMLENNSISVMRTRLMETKAAGADTYRVYRLEFGTDANGDAEPQILLRYQVTYDLASGEVLELIPEDES